MARKMAIMDWRAIKYYHVRICLMLIFSFIIGLFVPIVALPLNVLMFLLFSTNTFAVEEKGMLNQLYLSLPVKRSAVVGGRYIFAAFMGLIGLATGIPISIVSNHFALSKYYGPVIWYLPIIAISYMLFTFFLLAMFPILFRLGYNKGKFWGYILPLIFIAALAGIFGAVINQSGNELWLINILEYAGANALVVSGGIAILATLFLLISYRLSQYLYSKREF